MRTAEERIDRCICGKERPRGPMDGWHILLSHDPKSESMVSNLFCPLCSQAFIRDPGQFLGGERSLTH